LVTTIVSPRSTAAMTCKKFWLAPWTEISRMALAVVRCNVKGCEATSQGQLNEAGIAFWQKWCDGPPFSPARGEEWTHPARWNTRRAAP
jgi:hypothetical protein